MLRTHNHARSMTFGTQSHLRLPFPCAVKTGTSTDYKDNFCIGFTKEFTVGVWVGNIDSTPMQSISGVTGAGPIFKQTMLALHRELHPTWLNKPTEVKSYAIDPDTGKILPSNHPRKHLAEKITLLHPPETATPSDYANSKVILDQRFSNWVQSHQNRYTIRSPLQYDAPLEPLKILSPTHNAIYLLDPDIPGSGQTLELKASSTKVTWTSTTLDISDNKLTLRPGKHFITATSHLTEHQKVIEITVESM